MRYIIGLILSLFMLLPSWASDGHVGHSGHAHDGRDSQFRLDLRLSPDTVEPGQPVLLTMALYNGFGQMMTEFDVMHEKKMHLIIVRDGLDIFAHHHPEMLETGEFEKRLIFPEPGVYRLFADFAPLGGQASTAMASLTVAGDPPSAPALEPYVPGQVRTPRLVADVEVNQLSGLYQIVFDLSDENDMPINDLEPYLGAMGHLVILSASGEDYVHAHPLQATSGNRVAFDVRFPKPGIYKGWGEFKRGGQVHDVAIVFRVDQ
jgi:hypothetical protein